MSDYISREAAIKELLDTYEREFPTADGAFDLFAVRIMPRVLRNIPTADVEPVRHGQWISLTDCSNAGVYCSICHKKVYKEDYAWCNRKNKLRSAYCPSCGSKMDLEE